MTKRPARVPTSGAPVIDARPVVELLYSLLCDHLPARTVKLVVSDATIDSTVGHVSYDISHIARYAQQLADQLTAAEEIRKGKHPPARRIGPTDLEVHPRCRWILLQRFTPGKLRRTYKSIGTELGLSPQRVRFLEGRAIQKLLANYAANLFTQED